MKTRQRHFYVQGTAGGEAIGRLGVKLTQQLHIFFFVINLGIFISLDFQPSEFENAFIKYIEKVQFRKNVKTSI